MKNFKLVAFCLALFATAGLNAQNSNAPVKEDGKTEVPVSKDGETKKGTKESKNDSVNKAKEYTTQVVELLNIKDPNVISTIATVNENYEMTLTKSLAKGNLTEEEAAALADKLEANRVNRFKGILTPAQMKEYTMWKQKKAAESTAK